jgi:hypothetical protein
MAGNKLKAEANSHDFSRKSDTSADLLPFLESCGMLAALRCLGMVGSADDASNAAPFEFATQHSEARELKLNCLASVPTFDCVVARHLARWGSSPEVTVSIVHEPLTSANEGDR